MFNYFGSKQRLAPTYQAPRYQTIVEPFAGAAMYSMYWLARRSDLTAVLYDIDPLVVDLWNRLLAMTPREIADYPLPVVGERSNDMIWGAANRANSRWSMVADGRAFKITEWTPVMVRQQAARMARDRAMIGDRVTVIHGSYETAPNVSATWFVDPPYQHQGDDYAYAGLDYTRLSTWCHDRLGQTIVCEGVGADWLPFEPHRTLPTLGRSHETDGAAIEYVWYSYPEPNLFTNRNEGVKETSE